MPQEKNPPSPDIQSLAREACDLWQEHLASYAADPKAKAEIMKLMAPSRQLFAEWATLMQNTPYGANSFGKTQPTGQTGSATSGATGGGKSRAAGSQATGAATAGAASHGGAHELAELAGRVAELEERLARYEAGSAGKTQKPQ